MINIAQFIGSTGEGGAETIVKDYACNLNKEEFNVTVIVRRVIAKSQNEILLEQNGIKVIPIYKRNSLLWKVIQKTYDWWYVPYRLCRIIKEENIQVLHIHLELLNYVKRIRKLIPNVKLVFTCHTHPSIIFKKHPEELTAARILHNENNMRIIALNDSMRKEINQLLSIDDAVVIHNGIDVKRFKTINKTKEEIRASLNIPGNAFVIGHVGRFSGVKNHSFLVDVFAKVAERKEEAFLLMVGSGTHQDEIEQKLRSLDLQNKYKILSHRTDIPDLLQAMDVFVFPSKYEGSPIALLEAEISGLKCVVSDNVPDESIITSATIKMSLDSTADKWCDVIFDTDRKSIPAHSVDDYNKDLIIKQLETLYKG